MEREGEGTGREEERKGGWDAVRLFPILTMEEDEKLSLDWFQCIKR